MMLGSVDTPSRYKEAARVIRELRPSTVVCTGFPNLACAGAAYAEDEEVYVEWMMPAPVLPGSNHYDAEGFGAQRDLVDRFNDQLLESSRRGASYDLLASYKRTTMGSMASCGTYPTLRQFNRAIRRRAAGAIVIVGDIWFPTRELVGTLALVGV
jgi:hypothetical protein